MADAMALEVVAKRLRAVQPSRLRRRDRLHGLRHLLDRKEWTLSITHTDEAVDRYVEVSDGMAREITEG